MSDLDDLTSRRQFDFSILSDMRCDVFDFTAYATIDDLNMRRRPITSKDGGRLACKYHLILSIPTLIGQGRLSRETEIGVSTDVVDYPINEPNTWVISKETPWSPHFRSGLPVCIGDEAWKDHGGHVTLGHLVLHLARLLNWDEKGRGPGYVGWNGEAIEYHRKHYHGRPLNPAISYPVLPGWLSGAPNTPSGGFEIISRSSGYNEW